ncbi:MAG: FeoC-like transcriptional regulator [Endozoicomonas sp.]
MLIEVKSYVSGRGACTLAELSTHFDVSPDALRGMLDHWIRKGKMVCEQSGCSKGCMSCTLEQLETYRWTEVSSDTLIPVCQHSGA